VVVRGSEGDQRTSSRTTSRTASVSVWIVPDEGQVAKGNRQGETGEDQLEDLQVLPNAWTTTRRRRKERWFDTLDLEASKAYGKARMSGQGVFDAFFL